MSKILKYALLCIAAVVGVAVVGIVYIVLTFDPNDYKAQIIQAVKDDTQRNLHLDGDIKLSFFPNVGASLGNISISEFKNEKEFIAIKSARVSLALLPLLSQRVIVDEVVVSGLKATLIKYKDGTTNIDDLLGKDGSPKTQAPQKGGSSSPIKFDIDSVLVEKVNFSYLDEISGAQYAINDLTLKTGRIANDVPSKIYLSVGLQANQPELDVVIQFETMLTFDLNKKKYQLQDMALQANGVALDFSELNIAAKGNVNADTMAQEFSVNNFELNTILRGTFGHVVANLSLPELKSNKQSLKTSMLNLDLDIEQHGQAFKVNLNSPLSGDIETQQFNLSDLRVEVNATGDKLPNKSVSSEMKGSVRLDNLKESMQADFAGGLLQSQIKAKIGVKGFTDPAIKFDLALDKLDADLYLPKNTSESKVSVYKQPEQPLDLTALKTLNLEGSLRIDSLKAANVKVSKLRVDVKARNGQVNVSPLSANLYQGSTDGKIIVNANTYSFAINQKLKGVEVEPLLKDASELEIAEGKGNILLDLSTQGKTVSALKKALNGNVSVNLTNGAIKGINLTKLVEGVQNLSKDTRSQTLGVDKSEKTEFSEFKANFRVKNGVAHNDDLAVKSTVLRLTGNGDIDIGHDNMDYNANVILAKTQQGRTATLPVIVSGPFDALKFKVNYGALFVDAAKQKINEKKEEVKTKIKADAKEKVQEELTKGLKNLFR